MFAILALNTNTPYVLHPDSIEGFLEIAAPKYTKSTPIKKISFSKILGYVHILFDKQFHFVCYNNAGNFSFSLKSLSLRHWSHVFAFGFINIYTVHLIKRSILHFIFLYCFHHIKLHIIVWTTCISISIAVRYEMQSTCPNNPFNSLIAFFILNGGSTKWKKIFFWTCPRHR